MKKIWLIHPFLFGLYPTLYLYSVNLDEVVPADLFLPVGLTLLIAIVCLPIFRFLLGSFEKASIVTSSFFVLFFSFGELKDRLYFLGVLFDGLQPLYRYLGWVALLCVLPFLITIILVARAKSVNKLTRMMMVLIILLILGCIFTIAKFQMNLIGLEESQEKIAQKKIEREVLTGNEILPDIYYIILDGYGGPKSTGDFYGFDNEEFIRSLKERGFYVSDRSRSNYGFTMRSLPSTLNMNYMDELYAQFENVDQIEFSVGRSLIQNNFVTRFLKERGYKYFHFGSSGFPPTKASSQADKNFSIEKFDEFERMLLKRTALGPTQTVLTSVDRRNNILYVFDQLNQVPEEEGLVFSFAHFIIPHPPYVFDQEGNSYSFVQLAKQEGFKSAKHYVDQTIFTNNKLLEFIDKVMAESKEPPVIILQGDHGPRPEWRGLKSFLVDRDNPEAFREYLRETMNILNAYYVPEGVKENLYDDITPVNSFRVLFNGLFGTDFKLLQDETFIFDGERGELVNVTEQVIEALTS